MTATCKYASSYKLPFYGTLVKGFACGLFTHYGPLMISETVHERYKNIVGAGNLVALTFGYLVSIFLGMEGILGGQDTWPFVLFVPGALSIVMLGIMFFLPETPRYLFQIKKDEVHGKDALIKLRGSKDNEDIEQEIIQLKAEPKEDDEESSTFSSLWNDLAQRKRMFGCILLQVSRQFTSTLAIVYYSTSLYVDRNMDVTLSQNATMIMIVCLLIGTIISVFLIKKMPLKTLYLTGLSGIMLSLLGMTVLLHMMEEPEFTAASYPFPYQYILMFFTIVLVFSFGIGPAAIPWQMPFAIMESRYHFLVSTMSASVNWLGSTLNAFLFPRMKANLGDLLFLPFLVIQVVMFAALLYLLPSKEKIISKNNDTEELERGDKMIEETTEKVEMVSLHSTVKDSNNNDEVIDNDLKTQQTQSPKTFYGTKKQSNSNQITIDKNETNENSLMSPLYIKLNVSSIRKT